MQVSLLKCAAYFCLVREVRDVSYGTIQLLQVTVGINGVWAGVKLLWRSSVHVKHQHLHWLP